MKEKPGTWPGLNAMHTVVRVLWLLSHAGYRLYGRVDHAGVRQLGKSVKWPFSFEQKVPRILRLQRVALSRELAARLFN